MGSIIIKQRSGQRGADDHLAPATFLAGHIFQVPLAPLPSETETPPTDAPSPADLEPAAEPAPDVLRAQALVEAAAIRAAAADEAARLREQAQAEGYEAGLAAGQAAAHQAIDASVGQLQALAAATAVDQAAMWQAAERQIVDLALAVARVIVRREVERVPEGVTRVLADILSQLQGEAVTCLRAHPDDLPILEQYWTAHGRATNERPVMLVADPRLTRGGCLAETTTGAWDATIEAQLERIEQALLATSGAER